MNLKPQEINRKMLIQSLERRTRIYRRETVLCQFCQQENGQL